MAYEKPTQRSLFVLSVVLLIATAAYGFPFNPAVRGERKKAETNPPGFLFSTVLDNISVNANGGWIKIGTNMVAVFLPENAKGKLVLSDASGKEFCHWDWSANRGRFNAPFQTVNFRNAMAPSGNQFNSPDLKLTKPGKYVFDFYTGGKKFYTFPVTIRELKPSNPFGGDPKYLVDGDWSDWGYLYIPDSSPNSTVTWKIWLREWEFKPVTRNIVVSLFREGTKEPVAENRVRTSSTFRHDWKRQDFELHKRLDNSLFKGRDLLGKNGNYRLSMTMNGREYGTWKFKVAAGKLVTTGRAARGSADPLTFVEGGGDAYWLKKALIQLNQK